MFPLQMHWVLAIVIRPMIPGRICSVVKQGPIGEEGTSETDHDIPVWDYEDNAQQLQQL